jgi:hypothetical protein
VSNADGPRIVTGFSEGSADLVHKLSYMSEESQQLAAGERTGGRQRAAVEGAARTRPGRAVFWRFAAITTSRCWTR